MDRSERRSLSRRRLLGVGSTVGVVLAAGCLDGTDSNDEAPSSGDTGEEYEPVDHPGDEPISFPEEYRCPVCNMIPVEYSYANAQLAHENGHGKFFDSAGCLFAYYADPEFYEGPDSAVVGAWTTGFETGELIDATEAHFVLDPHRNNDPMDSPVPFEEYDDALAYVDSYDDVSEADIAELEDADSDAAASFR